MIETSDLIKNLADQKPAEFASNFDQLIKTRISKAVADKKVELSSTLFGAPEAVDDNEQEEPEETDDSEKTETDNNN